MTTNRATQIVELALSASTANDCVVLVEEISSANLRWANNTLTTNGFSLQLRCTVISVVNGAVATVRRDGVTPASVSDLVALADHAARGAPQTPTPWSTVRPTPRGARRPSRSVSTPSRRCSNHSKARSMPCARATSCSLATRSSD